MSAGRAITTIALGGMAIALLALINLHPIAIGIAIVVVLAATIVYLRTPSGAPSKDNLVTIHVSKEEEGGPVLLCDGAPVEGDMLVSTAIFLSYLRGGYGVPPHHALCAQCSGQPSLAPVVRKQKG